MQVNFSEEGAENLESLSRLFTSSYQLIESGTNRLVLGVESLENGLGEYYIQILSALQRIVQNMKQANETLAYVNAECTLMAMEIRDTLSDVGTGEQKVKRR